MAQLNIAGTKNLQKKLKFSQKKVWELATGFFSQGRQKFKKYLNLKRSCKELKLCALKIKIKFDDIISIKNIISGPQLLENIPEYIPKKRKLNQNSF
jgi:hypothetical protein